jgi:hypothetical protein
MANDLIPYTTDDGQSRLVLREPGGQVWLTQLEMAELYQTSKQNIGKHVKAVLSENELAEGAVVNRKFTAQPAPKRVDGVVNVDNNYPTTHPLQGHLVGCCLGRKNRLRAVFSFLA